MTHTNREMVPK